MLLKLILWYLKKIGWDYTIENKNHKYMNYPNAKFNYVNPSAILHIDGKPLESVLTDIDKKELHNYMEDNPR